MKLLEYQIGAISEWQKVLPASSSPQGNSLEGNMASLLEN